VAFGDIAKLLASLDLDTKPFEKGSRRVSGDLSKMEGGLGRVSTRAIALGSAVGVGIERLAEKGISVLFGAIRSGEDNLHILQESIGQTNAIIESTGGVAGVSATQVRDLAESLEQLTTVDDKAVQAGENVLLRYTGIGKEIFPQATKAATDLAVAMAKGDAANADVAQSAAQIGKALQDPIKGLTSLRKAGVVFTAQEQDQIKALVKAGDTMGAQQAILKALEVRYGKAGEAAGKTGASGIRRLNDAVEDAQIALAEGLSPALDDIRAEIAKGLSDPGTKQDLRNLCVFLGDAAKSGIAFAKSVPWDQIGEGLKTAAGFAGKLIDVFAHLPPGVQGTIIGLAALNKLGGGGVIKIGVDLFKEGAKGLLGQIFQRGSSPANPMFVTGTGLGGAGVPTPGGGGLGLASKLFLVGEAIGLIAAVNEVRDNIAGQLTEQTKGVHDAVSQQINDTKTTAGQLQQSLDGVNQGIEALSHDPIGNALLGDQKAELEKMRAEFGSALKAQDDTNKANFRQSERDDATHTAITKQAIERSRDATEAARIAIATRISATTNKVGDLVRAESGQTSRIVTAIQRNRPVVNVKVNVAHGDTIRVTKNYTTGGSLGRTGGQQEFG
jgi:hypothetical protein